MTESGLCSIVYRPSLSPQTPLSPRLADQPLLDSVESLVSLAQSLNTTHGTCDTMHERMYVHSSNNRTETQDKGIIHVTDITAGN